MNGPTRIVALSLAAVLSVLGMACEQQTDTGEPIEEDTPADGGDTEPTPTPEDT